MLRVSSMVAELNEYLLGLLQPIEKRLKAELALRPLDAEQVREFSQRSLTLITAVNRSSYERASDRLTLYMSSVLPYRLDAGDKTGRLALDVVPALVTGLARFDAEWLDSEIRNIDANNLSLLSKSVALWGFRYDIRVPMTRIATSGAELGQLLELGDLGDFEEAGGRSKEQAIEAEARLDRLDK